MPFQQQPTAGVQVVTCNQRYNKLRVLGHVLLIGFCVSRRDIICHCSVDKWPTVSMQLTQKPISSTRGRVLVIMEGSHVIHMALHAVGEEEDPDLIELRRESKHTQQQKLKKSAESPWTCAA